MVGGGHVNPKELWRKCRPCAKDLYLKPETPEQIAHNDKLIWQAIKQFHEMRKMKLKANADFTEGFLTRDQAVIIVHLVKLPLLNKRIAEHGDFPSEFVGAINALCKIAGHPPLIKER